MFLQIALGGLLTFTFITPEPHIITGFVVLILAIATMVLALTAKPPYRPIIGLSIGLVVLLVVQIILGFATLDNSSDVIAWIHLVNAMAIYGMAVAGISMAMKWDRVSKESSSSDTGARRNRSGFLDLSAKLRGNISSWRGRIWNEIDG